MALHKWMMNDGPATQSSHIDVCIHTTNGDADDWHIFYYCAPLRPTPLYWCVWLGGDPSFFALLAVGGGVYIQSLLAAHSSDHAKHFHHSP